jgi:hypothetical protein
VKADLKWALIIAASLIAVTVTALVGICFVGVRLNQAHQHAIIRVVNENGKAILRCRVKRPLLADVLGDDTNRDYVSTPQFAKELRKIDITGCPTDFQNAWVEYVQAWERQAESPLGGVVAVTELGVAAKVGADVAANDAIRKLNLRDKDEAWRNCELVALKYGVTFRTESHK